MADYAQRVDQYTVAFGFQVEISGGDAVTSREGSWKRVDWNGCRLLEVSDATVGTEQFHQHTHGQREWTDLTLVGALTGKRKAMLQWYKDTVAGKDHRRNISLILLARDGTELKRYDLQDTFIIGYQLTQLEGGGQQECEETVTICVGSSNNYLS
jgi:hypothetical protein